MVSRPRICLPHSQPDTMTESWVYVQDRVGQVGAVTVDDAAQVASYRLDKSPSGCFSPRDIGCELGDPTKPLPCNDDTNISFGSALKPTTSHPGTPKVSHSFSGDQEPLELHLTAPSRAVRLTGPPRHAYARGFALGFFTGIAVAWCVLTRVLRPPYALSRPAASVPHLCFIAS